MDDAFHDRERQFEAKFAHDQEILFRARVHRDRLFAAWAAEQLGDRAPPGFTDRLVAFAFEKTPEAVIDKVARKFRAQGADVPEGKIRRAFAQCADQAREEVLKTLPPETR